VCYTALKNTFSIDEFHFEGNKRAVAILRIHETLYRYCEMTKGIRSKDNTIIEKHAVTPARQC
jgi:hypothetical protein